MDNQWHYPFLLSHQEGYLLTLDVSTKKNVSKLKEATVKLKSDRETFAPLLIIPKSKNVDLKEDLEHELCLIPLFIANPDRSLTKAIISKLFTLISFTKGFSVINNNRSTCFLYL